MGQGTDWTQGQRMPRQALQVLTKWVGLLELLSVASGSPRLRQLFGQLAQFARQVLAMLVAIGPNAGEGPWNVDDLASHVYLVLHLGTRPAWFYLCQAWPILKRWKGKGRATLRPGVFLMPTICARL